MTNRWEDAAALDYLELFHTAAINSINPHVQAVFDALNADAKRAHDLGGRWMPVSDLDDALVQLAHYLTTFHHTPEASRLIVPAVGQLWRRRPGNQLVRITGIYGGRAAWELVDGIGFATGRVNVSSLAARYEYVDDSEDKKPAA